MPSGGAGNKLMMLLEGKGAVYIQDRGVSRWDTCGPQAVISVETVRVYHVLHVYVGVYREHI